MPGPGGGNLRLRRLERAGRAVRARPRPGARRGDPAAGDGRPAGGTAQGACMNTSRILVVDDEANMVKFVASNLRVAGYEVVTAIDGEEALSLARHEPMDLIILDLMLPGIDGVEVCKQIRGESMVPIVMLTARGETQDVVAGLEAGADDYIVKPFKHPSELIARIRTRLRRSNILATGQLTIGDLKIDMVAHEVARGDKKILLTRLEFELLAALAKEPGRVFTRDALLSEVWGYQHSSDTRLVNVHVQRLRSKIEIDPDNPQIVLTVRGVGYRAGTPSK